MSVCVCGGSGGGISSPISSPSPCLGKQCYQFGVNTSTLYTMFTQVNKQRNLELFINIFIKYNNINQSVTFS